MKNKILIGVAIVFALIVAFVGLRSLENVPSGYVAVVVDRYGDSKGVNMDVKGPGRYFSTFYQDYYLFPTFSQTKLWERPDQKGDPDEQFHFQDVDGAPLSVDIGVTYSILPENAARVFQKYRLGVDEITDKYLKLMIRDTLIKAASTVQAEEIFGKGKSLIQTQVEKDVIQKAEKVGITVERVYFASSIRMPKSLMDNINAKISAIQAAARKVNELQQVQADADKAIAAARGEAQSIEIRAKALRENPIVLQQEIIRKWDGKYPQYYAGSGEGLPKVVIPVPAK